MQSMNAAYREYTIPVQSFRKELTRKMIHITIALVPVMAEWNFTLTVLILSSGILFYVVNETARMAGRPGGFISRLTIAASRPVERGFVWGPVTLGLGALAALLYYPNPAATVAIYALAFGDAVASLAGKFLGGRHAVRIGEKTMIGSFSCLLAVFVSSYAVLNDYRIAMVSAVTATVLELVASQELDNLIIPLGTGLIVTLFI